MVTGALVVAVACWGEGVSTADRNRGDKLIKEVGVNIRVQQVVERRRLSKLKLLMINPAHPLHDLEVNKGCIQIGSPQESM